MRSRNTQILAFVAVFPLAAALCCSSVALAAAPSTVAVHGTLSSGAAPVVDGKYAVLFALHDAKAAGNVVWSSGSVEIELVAGAFHHELGATKPLGGAVDTADSLWLGVTVGAYPELPRVAVGAVLRARRAAIADGVVCTGCIATAHVAAGAITPEKAGFGFAASVDGKKSGVAVAAAKLDCTGCVTVDHLKFDKDVDLGARALAAGKLTSSGDIVAKGTVSATKLAATTLAATTIAGDGDATVKGTVTAGKFVGDGAGISGLNIPKMPAGVCTKDGEAVTGIKADGTVLCGERTTTARFRVADKEPVKCDATKIGETYVDKDGKALHVCNGKEYAPVFLQPVGSANNPVASCDALRTLSPGANSGLYWVQSGGSAVQVHCDMQSHGGGWTALARMDGTTWEYDSNLWSTTTLHNATDAAPSWNSAKHATFNTLPIKELLLVSQGGKWTVVKLPSAGASLLDWFKKTTTVLTWVAGAAHPLELVNGQSKPYCGKPWRLNTLAVGSKAKIRLGGWYNLEWDCSYGLDAAGEKTGAHLVGFGLRDENWCPCTKNKKSFGIRDAHDQAVSSNNLGQYESAAMIYGR